MHREFYRKTIFAALIFSAVVPQILAMPVFVLMETFSKGFGVVFKFWIVFFIVSLCFWAISASLYVFFKKKKISDWLHLLASIALAFLIGMQLNKFLFSFLDDTPLMLVASRREMGRLFLVMAITGSAHLILVLIHKQMENIRVIKQNAALSYKNLESKYKLLKEQINPHFLFNALNVSKSLVKRDPDKAEQFIVQLSGFLRNSIDNNQISNSLQAEINLCNDYLDLQQVRFGGSIDWNINTEKEKLTCQVPYFTLVTLVENAIKHNAFSRKNPLHLQIYTEQAWLIVSNRLNQKSGVVGTKTGLKNLDERSILFSDSNIEVNQNEDQFVVKVKLVAA